MAPLTHSRSALGLVTGFTVAAALSGGAVLTVANSGCDDPGSYQFRDGVVELVGGCLQPGDLPVRPAHAEESPQPLVSTDPAVAP